MLDPKTYMNEKETIPIPTLFIGGKADPGNSEPAEISTEDFMNRVAHARRHEKHLCKKIQKARKQGKKNWLRSHIHRYLTSYDVKLAILANRNQHKRFGAKLEPNRLLELVEKIDVFSKCDETVTVHVKPKKPGSFDGRAILSFGPIESTRQEMLRRVMQVAIKEPTKNQFSTRRGVNKAIRLAKQHLAEGFVYVIEADIRSCFANYDKSKLLELFNPIPGIVIQEVLVPELEGRLELLESSSVYSSGPELNAPFDVLEQKADPVFVKARSGLMQGAVASPLASELLLARVMRVMTSEAPGKVINFADNFLLMAKTQNDAVLMFKALKVLLKNHPAGPLSLKLEWNTSETDGYFQFLGYKFQNVGNSWKVFPTDENRQTFTEEANRLYKRLLTKNIPAHRRMKLLNKLKTYIWSWTAAFIEAPVAHQLRSKWTNRIENVKMSWNLADNCKKI